MIGEQIASHRFVQLAQHRGSLRHFAAALQALEATWKVSTSGATRPCCIASKLWIASKGRYVPQGAQGA